ncbi:RNA-directed RNA polymerase [Actinidia chinensis var. chinensis]|uniref:RNA-directed RNA polymerase n=1 Tax=Actinidia chinensis var. chinensis TaxID=1590841 RepID=A0A2R6QCY1_ACTCC|nr:RNA-directed RNA polymerase [Actinidia chinensis var. chinensis]
MKRGHRKMWWVVVPRANRKNLKTKSRKDMEEILKTKLATIKEEPEMCDDNRALSNHLWVAKKGKQIGSKTKTGRVFVMPQFSLKDFYLLLFMNRVAPKGRPTGLPQP